MDDQDKREYWMMIGFWIFSILTAIALLATFVMLFWR